MNRSLDDLNLSTFFVGGSSVDAPVPVMLDQFEDATEQDLNVDLGQVRAEI